MRAIRLDVGELAKGLGDLVEHEEIKGMQSDRALREKAAAIMLVLLVVLNVLVILLIVYSVAHDREMILAKTITPEQRFVTEKTLIALISGVVAQTAAIVLVIMGYLFPKRSGGNQNSTGRKQEPKK